jgi:hypothetical protein
VGGAVRKQQGLPLRQAQGQDDRLEAGVRQKQIPCGNDRKNGKSKGKSKSKNKNKNKNKNKSKSKNEGQYGGLWLRCAQDGNSFPLRIYEIRSKHL